MSNESHPPGEWCRREFSSIDLGDKRLNNRFIKTAELLAKQPLASINQACENWADSKAAYRLLDNEKVTMAGVLAPHQERTAERVKGFSRILVIQDTSHFNYSDHPRTTGLGSIGFTKNHASMRDTIGLNMHCALAVTTDGLPLGLLHQELWARDDSAPKSKLSFKRIPILEKESNKWLKGVESTVRLMPRGVEAITVCDRESDLFEFVAKARALDTHYLIRSAWNRAIRVEHEEGYLWDYMKTLDCQGCFSIKVETKKRNPLTKLDEIQARTSKLEVRFAKIDLRRPTKKIVDRTFCPAFIPAYAVWVKEIDAPQEIEPLEWMLLTSVPVTCLENALERVDWYKLRWHIENFHKVLKSGCRVEACRLETAGRLKKYITVCSVVAWRIYWMTHLNRQAPDQSCAVVLSEPEWQALYCRINKTTVLPEQPPTIHQAVRWIAQLGGFLGRKGDGEPGITTTWRGWQRLNDITEDWILFGEK